MAAVFTLEALFARKGDALLLHHGPPDDLEQMLIDGGPRGVYAATLRPRLESLRASRGLDSNESLPLRMVMVSHADDGHVAGVLDMFLEMAEARDRQRPLPFKVETLWHNSFDDILGNSDEEIVSRLASVIAGGGATAPLHGLGRDGMAVVASTAQGRNLRNAARKLGVRLNHPFTGLVMAPAAKSVSLDHGLSLTVIGPARAEVEAYQKKWDKDLEAILRKKAEPASAAAFSDESPFNLASICVLAEMKKKRMLLTGDARGDKVMEGLEAVGLLKGSSPFHVDLLKVPHHGSDRNVDGSFFERVTADHYVISGDGEHGNPERETLEMIQRARRNDECFVHFTFTGTAHCTEKDPRRKKALTAVAAWVEAAPRTIRPVYRDAADVRNSISVDLLDRME